MRKLHRQSLNQEIATQEGYFADAENRLAEYLNSLHGKESESETVRFSLMELEKEISLRTGECLPGKDAASVGRAAHRLLQKGFVATKQNEAETLNRLSAARRQAQNSRPGDRRTQQSQRKLHPVVAFRGEFSARKRNRAGKTPGRDPGSAV